MAGKRKSAEAAREAEAVDIVAATLQLAAQQGWRHTTYADIAAASGLPLADLLKRYPTRQSILAELSRRADAAMVAAVEADGGESTRERLFAVIMARFDALQPHRDGLRRVVADTRLDPCAVLAAGRTLERSFGWMLELAGVSASGLAGLMRRKALGFAYADVARIWLEDDSADLGTTMAALDRRLAQLERLATRFSGSPLPSLDGAPPTA